jgi:hypothetical protein
MKATLVEFFENAVLTPPVPALAAKVLLVVPVKINNTATVLNILKLTTSSSNSIWLV